MFAPRQVVSSFTEFVSSLAGGTGAASTLYGFCLRERQGGQLTGRRAVYVGCEDGLGVRPERYLERLLPLEQGGGQGETQASEELWRRVPGRLRYLWGKGSDMWHSTACSNAFDKWLSP